jgi:hypothetical protein
LRISKLLATESFSMTNAGVAVPCAVGTASATWSRNAASPSVVWLFSM